ncbi:fatty acyl-AMP ligase [Phenylobacterium sp.]|uniref:fatty acyl-AMP ligase n=1 Tax=Phenylobacterium sp. TaxID=1871053 RepID=UPI003782EF82
MTPTPTAPDRDLRLGFATLIEALEFAATRPTGVNLYDQRGQLALALPYATLRDEAEVLARRLLAWGLAPGDRVGLVADTEADFVRLFFACQYAALIPAPLPLPAPLAGRQAWIEQIGRLLSSAGAAAVFGPAGLMPWLTEAAEASGARPPIAPEDLPADAAAALPEIAPAAPCYVQFSSGSTRTPTGVLVTHQALMANALAITRDGLKVKPSDRAVSWLPLYHDMGLIGFLLSPLASQMTVDLLPTAAFVRRPLIWLDLITRNGGTVSYSPTFGYELCARRADTADISAYDLSGWRIAGSGGDMVRPGPLRAFAARFAEVGFRESAFVASYGMAEATLALTMAPLDTGIGALAVDIQRMEQDGLVRPAAAGRQLREFVSCGPVLPGHQLEVRGPNGAPLPEGQVGRVFVRGPSIMQGYLGQPEATAAVLDADGWLDTGDLGFLDGGAFTPTGRSKDLILLNGRNIWPQDLEWTAEAEVDRLRSGDVAAFAVEGDEDKVVVLVQTRSSDPDVRAGLLTEVTAVLRARHALDVQVELVGAHALPQTSSGKLSRSKARALYLSGAFRAVEPA